MESISGFYTRFLGYVSCIRVGFGVKVLEIAWEAMNFGDGDRDLDISRAFLVALSRNFPLIKECDGDKLITVLLDKFSLVNGADELSFEGESIESLEKLEIAFILVTHVLVRVKVDLELHLQVRSIAKRQVQSMYAFLKSRRCDWDEQESVLKTRVEAKLFVYQAAVNMEIESLLSLETDGREKLVLEALMLVLTSADACFSPSNLWKASPHRRLFSPHRLSLSSPKSPNFIS